MREQSRVSVARWRARNPEAAKAKEAAYRERNADAIRERKRRYSQREAERLREKNSRYYAANRERLLAQMASYRARNAESLARSQVRYRKERPEVIRACNQRRRARAREARVEPFALADLFADWEERGLYACTACGAPWEHIDHVIPLSKGGAHSIANLQPLCAACNLSKSDRDPWVWVAELLGDAPCVCDS
ncbi:HNH endonuclease signature motif containing protein [Streptomyces halobius]|uniref:HNH endonuclease n=1 Tax=Streptomyces halobius TaxID=2879846 RepID=A0ABY4MB75_9ACTN|nr:HNH endonuclease signature motif containing protein [Streptomyces halobius]UQA94950.1 HNH endonuclease [Streptomyces halobius]